VVVLAQYVQQTTLGLIFKLELVSEGLDGSLESEQALLECSYFCSEVGIGQCRFRGCQIFDLNSQSLDSWLRCLGVSD